MIKVILAENKQKFSIWWNQTILNSRIGGLVKGCIISIANALEIAVLHKVISLLQDQQTWSVHRAARRSWKGQFSMRSVLTHLLTNGTVSKLLYCGRENQNYIHIDTYYCKPELVPCKIIIIVFNLCFLFSTNQKYTDSSTFWQFLCYHPPSKFQYIVGETAKI